METHSSILAWELPWSLAGYSPKSRKESQTHEHRAHGGGHNEYLHTHILMFLSILEVKLLGKLMSLLCIYKRKKLLISMCLFFVCLLQRKQL